MLDDAGLRLAVEQVMARPRTAALLPAHQQPSLRRGGVAHRAGRRPEGKPIPLGWALDREAIRPRIPRLPAVELLVTALTGARKGFEASSFFVKGISPGLARRFGHRSGAPAGCEVYNVPIETCLRPCCRTKMSTRQGCRRRDLAHKLGRKG
jgi:hypothetical protein